MLQSSCDDNKIKNTDPERDALYIDFTFFSLFLPKFI